jgi:hypothetical protein
MRQERKILYCSIVSFCLLALYAAYLRYFPVIISSTITNIGIITLVVALLAVLVYEPFVISRQIDTYILLPQYLLFVFLVRAATTLRLTYQPLADPNYYTICTFNIIDFGTLEPLYSWWYPQVQQQLSWPDLHILGSVLTQLTDIYSVDVLRLSTPMYGMLFFLGVFVLAYIITRRSSVAFLAGLFASTAESVIFYQAEYHPQGLALVFFVFLIVLIFKYLLTGSLKVAVLVLLYFLAFTFAHHFSSLFFGIFSIYMFAVLSLPRTIFVRVLRFDPFSHRRVSSIIWLLASLLMFFNHFYRYSSFMDVVESSLNQRIAPMGELITGGADVPLQATLMNSTKYILLLLALVSVLYILKTRDENEFFSAILLFGVLFSGVIGTFIAFIPVDRLIGFYIPFAAIFASLTLIRFKETWFTRLRPSTKTTAVIAISLVILIAGPFNSMAPAIILHDLPKDPYYWHDNDFSAFSSFGIPGYWIKENVNPDTTFSTYNGTYMIPFFYGRIPLNDVYQVSGTWISSDYIVAGGDYHPGLGHGDSTTTSVPITDNSIYTMGKFRVGITD